MPSDHSGVMALPVTSGNSKRTVVTRKATIRPLPESLICKFGSQITNEDWSFLLPEMSLTELVGCFVDYTQKMIEETFPEKTVTISDWDKPFMTQELKHLRRQRQRIYRKGGRTPKYLDLKSKFDLKIKAEAENSP